MIRSTILRLRQKFFKDYVYISRHGLAKGLKRKGGLGFIPELFVSLTNEDKFIHNLDLADSTVYDIGGCEGVFSLYFSKAVGEKGKVITFEPSYANYKKILENIELNKFSNIEVKNIGLGSKRDTLELVYSEFEPGKGSIQEDLKTELLSNKKVQTITVDIHMLDEYVRINNIPEPRFVKIDVEGMELDVLSGMSEILDTSKPELFIEIHGLNKEKKIENVKNVVGFLKQKEYSICHIESGNSIDNSNVEKAMIGHLYCK